MNAILTQIIEGLREIFPDMDDMAITSDTELGEIPEDRFRIGYGRVFLAEALEVLEDYLNGRISELAN